ncbi:MAG: glutaminase [Balneolaceae bacterium]
MPQNYQKIIDSIYSELKTQKIDGKVADYIPELGKINPDKFGVHLCMLDGGSASVGDSNERFSIQSITKVFSLTMAISLVGEDLWKRVDLEPSGSAFNSLVQLEYEHGIPRNPLINAGALVVSDLLISLLKNPKEDYLAFVRKLCGAEVVDYNIAVAESEKRSGYRNQALINLMKSFGNIHNDIDTVLDFYYYQCSIEMTCKELAESFLVFVNHGVICETNEQLITRSQSKRISAIMLTCGFYDEAGEFAFRVGLPGKSGVGGGIVAVHPGRYSVAVWSPRLNNAGNSILGMKVLEEFTTKTGMSIF